MDAAIYRERIVNKAEHLCVENTAEGYRAMMTWIIGKTGVNKEDMPVCMEIYSLTFRCLFEEDGIACTMVSPLHLKKSLGLARGKNDRIDAFRIADFCCTHRHKLRPCRLPSDSLQQLKQLPAECDRYVNQNRHGTIRERKHPFPYPENARGSGICYPRNRGRNVNRHSKG